MRASRAGEYWIRNAGNAGRRHQRRTRRREAHAAASRCDHRRHERERHLLDDGRAAAAQPRSKRPLRAAASRRAPAADEDDGRSSAQAATGLSRPAFNACAPNTIIGPAPGSCRRSSRPMPTRSCEYRFWPGTPGVAPKFQPVADRIRQHDPGSGCSGLAPKFQPAEPEPDRRRTPSSARPVPARRRSSSGRSRTESIPNTIVEPANRGAAPKFEASPSLMETVTQGAAAVTAADGGARKAPAVERPIKGVTLRGIGGVLNAPLGRSVIGRGATATIRIDSEEVSKVHAFLDVTATEVTLTDQKSVNGTDGQRQPDVGAAAADRRRPRRRLRRSSSAWSLSEWTVANETTLRISRAVPGAAAGARCRRSRRARAPPWPAR